MPSPKAVLRDIADLGLDPSKPYVCNKGGRLHPAPKIAPTSSRFTLEAPEPEKPVQNALKELPKKEEVEASTAVEVPAADAAVDETAGTADDAATTAGGGKKGKKTKAAKSEEPTS